MYYIDVFCLSFDLFVSHHLIYLLLCIILFSAIAKAKEISFLPCVCRYLELCRYAMCTCPTTSCVATLASEVTAFIGLRMCIPFALAKLNYPMQAIHMLYHPFKQHLPRALYDLVKVRVSDAAADQSGVAEDTLYSCQTGEFKTSHLDQLHLCSVSLY